MTTSFVSVTNGFDSQAALDAAAARVDKLSSYIDDLKSGLTSIQTFSGVTVNSKTNSHIDGTFNFGQDTFSINGSFGNPPIFHFDSMAIHLGLQDISLNVNTNINYNATTDVLSGNINQIVLKTSTVSLSLTGVFDVHSENIANITAIKIDTFVNNKLDLSLAITGHFTENDNVASGFEGVMNSLTFTEGTHTIKLTGLSLDYKDFDAFNTFDEFLNSTLAGDNNVAGTASADYLESFAGDDKLSASTGDDTLVGGDGNDTLDGGAGNDNLDGGAGDDTYYADLVVVGANASQHLELKDTITDSAGTDTLILRGQSSIANYSEITLQTELEKLDASATGTTKLNIIGNDNGDTLIGNAANNQITGGSGIDTISGGAGQDTMKGAAGGDQYTVDNIKDSVIEVQGEGHDTILSFVSMNMAIQALNVEDLALQGSAAINAIGNDEDNVLTGNSASNQLTGGKGDDTLSANAGADSLSGGEGNDKLEGGLGFDTLDGGAGADTLLGGDGNDVYVVGADDEVTEQETSAGGVDLIKSSVSYLLGLGQENLTLTGSDNLNGSGNTGVNIVNGNAGNNQLHGEQGTVADGKVDTLIGDAGNDEYFLNLAQVVSGAAATVKLEDAIIEKANGGNADSLTIDGVFVDANVSTVKLADFVENLYFANTLTTKLNAIGNAQDNYIEANKAANSVDGGLGNDDIRGNEGADTLSGGAGKDQLVGGADNDSLIGGVGDDTLLGGDGADNLSGGDGNDDFVGDAGADTLAGGLGNDRYFVVLEKTGDTSAQLQDQINEASNGGVDELWLRQSDVLTFTSSTTITLDNNLEYLNASDTTGSNLNLRGNDKNNYIIGNNMANSIEGGVGNDTLDGGTASTNDILVGGVGDDVYRIDDLTDTIVEDASGGKNDVIESSVTLSLMGYANIENAKLLGSGNENLTGSNAANQLVGNAGNNQLSGGEGLDTLSGGDGNDIYFINLALVGSSNATATVKLEDTVIEKANQGIDEIDLIGDFSQLTKVSTLVLGDNIEVLRLDSASSNTTKLNAIGNTLNNQLIGNSVANKLDGGAGNDTLFGNDGSDTLVGGLGHDVMNGQNGDDVTDGGDGNDSLFGGDGNDQLLGGIGNDFLQGGLDADTLVGGDGSDELLGEEGNDNLTGGAGNDFLTGGDGADTLAGGAGNDAYYVQLSQSGNDAVVLEDVVNEASNAGNDTLVLLLKANTTISLSAPVMFTLGNTFENIDIRALVDVSLNVNGNEASNQIVANNVDNIVDGAEGHDTLYGMAGKDTVLGGIGNDNLNGNEGDDTLFGGAGSDTLDGDDGQDTLEGGLGDDTYMLDNPDDLNDQIIESDKAGTDTVVTSFNYTLVDANTTTGIYLENLTLIGDKGLSGTGNNLNNVITGTDHNDTLDGAEAADKLIGGNGDDTYIVDLIQTGTKPANFRVALEDTITELANTASNKATGNDTLQLRGDFSDIANVTVLTLANNLENLDASQTASTRLNLTGNAADNVLTGNFADNQILGLAGADQLFGNAGQDMLDGGLANDTLDGGEGNDQLLGGVGDDNLLGQTGNDTLIGGAGNDELSGGAGHDVFLFNAALGTQTNVDTISDFVSEEDHIYLSHAIFTKLSVGNLNQDNLHLGSGLPNGLDSNDYLYLDTATGNLYYDKDGSASGVAVQVATLTNVNTLSASDFVIVA